MYFRTSEEIAEYDFVGITEKMDESLQCLSGLLGILYKKPRVWYNCTFGSVEPYTEYIPVLEENLKEYIDAYNEAKGALR